MSRSPSRDRSTSRAGRTLAASSGGGGGGEAVVPIQRAYTSGGLGSTSNTVTFPTGLTAGDLMLLFIGSDWDHTAPAGWTLVNHDSGTGFNGGIYYKIAAGGDVSAGSLTLTVGGSYGGTWACVAIQAGTYPDFPVTLLQHVRASATAMPYTTASLTTTSGGRAYYFGAVSVASKTISSNTGTAVLQRNDAQDSAALYGQDVAGDTSGTITWSQNSAGTNLGVYFAAVEVPANLPATRSRSAYATAVLADSPWGFWQFAETSGTSLADSSGNSRTLTVTGTVNLAQTSPFTTAAAIRFNDGTISGDNYAATSATSTASAVTMSCWLMVPSGALPDNSPIIGMANGYGGSTWDKPLYLNSDGKLHFEAFNGTNQVIDASAALTRDVWHHVVASVGAAGMKLRVDKTTVASNAGVTTSYTGVQNVFIHGGGLAHTGRPYMKIAAPAIFASQLSDGQTDAHYDAV